MKTLVSLALILATAAATPVLADRPFGTSNQGPPPAIQMDQDGR
jgi:hypothetical protein